MREIEQYYFEYVFLGLPRRAFFYLLTFRLRKGIRPTLYASRIPLLLKLSGTARFCEVTASNGRVLAGLLERHANGVGSKKAVLVYTPEFEQFSATYKDSLEKSFLIRKAEDIYEA